MSTEKAQRKVNIWKWAFISLVILLIVFTVWFASLFRMTEEAAPPEQEEITSFSFQIQDEDPYQLHMTLETQEVERLVNDYVTTLDMEDLALQVAVRDRLEIHARYNFINREWPFTIYLLPRVTENGNVILEVDDFRMGDLPVPEDWLIRILNTSIDWPSWIVPDAAAQTIDLNFNQKVFVDDFQVEVTQVDLKNERLSFNFFISPEIFMKEQDE